MLHKHEKKTLLKLPNNESKAIRKNKNHQFPTCLYIVNAFIIIIWDKENLFHNFIIQSYLNSNKCFKIMFHSLYSSTGAGRLRSMKHGTGGACATGGARARPPPLPPPPPLGLITRVSSEPPTKWDLL